MLELRPNCENCDERLPPESTEAWICSYECTFCRRCVEEVLLGVCPNCGGGFEPRPIRPRKAHRPGVCLDRQPATTERKVKPVDAEAHARFAAALKDVPPHER